MAKYLITGIAGFIGSTIARRILAQGDQVRGVDNLATGNQKNIAEIADRIDFRQADILDLDALHSACEGVDYVFHEAAIPSVPKSVLDPLGSNRANIDGTVNVLVAARDAKVKRVVYAASSSAYAAQTRSHEARSYFALRRSQAGQRAVYDFFLPLLRARNRGPALLQHLRSAAGSFFALFGRVGKVHHADAAWGTACHLRRWRAEPRLHLH